MDTIGFDLHKRESQLCIIGEDGTVTERRITTSRERLTAVLRERPRAACSRPRPRASGWRSTWSIEALASEDATVALLRTAPGIGTITAAAIVATQDDISRFRNAHQFEAFSPSLRAWVAVTHTFALAGARFPGEVFHRR